MQFSQRRCADRLTLGQNLANLLMVDACKRIISPLWKFLLCAGLGDSASDRVCRFVWGFEVGPLALAYVQRAGDLSLPSFLVQLLDGRGARVHTPSNGSSIAPPGVGAETDILIDDTIIISAV